MMKLGRQSRLGLLATTALSMLSVDASAQEASEYSGGEIIVTAQRRAQSVQDVPTSIAAMSGEDLIKAGVQSAADLGRLVPNVSVYSPLGEGTSPTFVIRGITGADYSSNQNQPIAVYLDDGLRGSRALQLGQLFDIERVEILRGPQGTLYGKNATGGAINIITRRPTSESEGYITAGYGNFNRVELRGAAQTPLVGDVLAARIAFMVVDDDGLVKNLVPNAPRKDETDLVSARLTLDFEPSDAFEATLRLFHSRSTGEGSGIVAGNVAGFLGVSRDGLDFFEQRANYNQPNDIRDTGFNLSAKVRLSDAISLTSITTYDWAKDYIPGDYDGTELVIDHIVMAADKIRQFWQEVRLEGDWGPLQLLVGGFYNDDSMNVSTTYTFFGEQAFGIPFDPNAFGVPYNGPALWGSSLRNFFRQERQSYSAYARAEYEIIENLTISGGIRYSHDKVSADDYTGQVGGTIETNSPLSTIQDLVFPVTTFSGSARADKFNNTSFEAGINYDFGNVFVYGSFRQGYRVGAVNAQAFETPAEITIVDPEKVNAFEFGIKYQHPDRWLTLNMAAFQNDYKNQQILNTEGALIVLRSVPKARIRGFEADLRLRPTERLTVSGGIGVLDPKYTESSLVTGNIDGNQLLGANKLTATAAVDWTPLEADGGEVNLHLDASYRSRTHFTIYNDNNVSQPGYWVMNGRISYDADRFSIAAWAKNLLNEKYYVSGFAYAAAIGLNEFNRGAPRQYGVEATFRF